MSSSVASATASNLSQAVDASPVAPGTPAFAPELVQAHTEAKLKGLPFAGVLTPAQSWALFNTGQARLVDVRSAEELRFVGKVPGAAHVPWQTGLSLNRNPRFVRELEQTARKDEVILLLCRSGKRSAQAAEAATQAGFRYVFNVAGGFEGDLDEQQQRGHLNGWRVSGLPWVQD